MALLVQESSNLPRIRQHFGPLIENRPMLLKDFLRDDASSHSRSLSGKSTAAAKSNKPHIVLLRSWSRRAAATKLSAVHKVIKLLHFASSKSPATISRKLASRRPRPAKDDGDGDGGILGGVSEVKVKVKDILRWRSFRDLAEDDPRPLDFPPSPHRSAAAAAAATSCSKRCDGENEELSTLKNPKGDWSSFEEYEQQSPVSVLDSPFQECTHFHQILENLQRAKWCHKGKLAIYEEKARQLLSQVEEDHGDDDEDVMLDFFIDEVSRNGKLHDDEFECEILRVARSWVGGEMGESYEWEVEEERESFVKDMERGFCWNKFEEERQEMCEDLEVGVFNCLLDDLLADFLC
ncbi:uncharacterized protein LOC130999199 [Salvia miltiorrhiza]|uniref:uncharacterized protein LOC130999199 n=1 Tax=Salvia miltiorrhiza TaxID=226208 RepID=UPI0025ABC2D0|nr:uncharacterized protein LOC130999199 [Salvia miltiorrhiza]